MEIKNALGDNYSGDYEPKVGEDLEPTITKRSKARAFRANRYES